MRIYILYKFIEGPWGGGNQFLKALREYFRKEGVYSESLEDADIILFNSHHCLDEVFKVKKKYPNKILIHRVGPIFHLARGDKALDKLVFQFNGLFADGTIFQSNWGREKSHGFGLRKCPYERTIINAPDPTIFNSNGKRTFNEKKVKLIATSWSANIRKGFDIYRYLDERLDLDKYEMTFVGNSSIEFKNIKWIKPVPSREVANILKEHDIYIIASRNDSCSNALIEALHCGLPAVARNDGGHPEIVDQAGALFENEAGVIDAIEKVAQNYKYYQAQIDLPTLDEVGQRYYEFAQSIYEDYLSGNYHPKEINFSSTIGFKVELVRWKAPDKLKAILTGLRNQELLVRFRQSLNYHQKKEWDKIAYSYLENCGYVLDIGCGTGRFISQNPQGIIGLDSRLESVRICKELGYSVVWADARLLPFLDQSTSAIHCSHLIEHFLPSDVCKILSECDRVLSPGGTLVIRSPLLWDGFYLELTHIRPYNPEGLIGYLEECAARSATKHMSQDYRVMCLKWRYKPASVRSRYLSAVLNFLNRWGFPWLKKNGYLLVLKKEAQIKNG